MIQVRLTWPQEGAHMPSQDNKYAPGTLTKAIYKDTLGSSKIIN